MNTKKIYIAPSIEMTEIEPMTMMAGSLKDPQGQPDPFKSIDPQAASIATTNDWNLWEDIDETNGYVE